MLTRRSHLHLVTTRLVQLVLLVLIILLVITIIGLIHFHLQHPSVSSLVTMGPAIINEVVQMVRMTVTWMVQSTVCPNRSPPSSPPTPCTNTTPVGCVYTPHTQYSHNPQSVGFWDNICCSFITETSRPASCLIERDMFSVAKELITPDDVVLEVGARYGTTTCAVARYQGNSGNLIAVEADPSVWRVLQYNLATHSCKAHLVLGVMGEKDLVLVDENQLINMPLGYAKVTSEDENAKGTHVAHFSWDDIETQTGLKINTVIFDCEGCMFPILKAYKHKFSQIQKVIIENDNHQGPNCDSECQEANRYYENSGFRLHSAFLSNLQANYVFIKDDI